MFLPLRKIFRSRPSRPPAAVPEGRRYYVIGDIHGRLDLFEALIAAVERDIAGSATIDPRIVLLGDLVDRGPDSAGVIARAKAWQAERQLILLAGNHEEMFLRSFDDTGTLRHFLRHGGRETILSYGLARDVYDAASLEDLQDMMTRIVPEDHLRFLSAARDYHVAGDYLFVHAGIAPGVEIEAQQVHHMRWIREPFLDHSGPHSHMVVHGHTITDGVDERDNRIGIDTGAYASGRLTALVLEGTERRYLAAVEGPGGIAIEGEDAAVLA